MTGQRRWLALALTGLLLARAGGARGAAPSKEPREGKTVATGKETGCLAGHTKGVAAIAVSGTTIATYGLDNSVRTWEAATGKELSHFTIPDHRLACFAPDGRSIIVLDHGGRVRLWDVAAPRERMQWQIDVSFKVLAVAPNGKVLAALWPDQSVTLWELATGKVLRRILPDAGVPRIRATTEMGLGKALPILTFSPDSTLIAVHPNESPIQYVKEIVFRDVSNAMVVYDVATGRPFRRFATSSVGMAACVFAPDGLTISTGNTDGSISLWELATGLERCRLNSGELLKKAELAGCGRNGVVIARSNEPFSPWDIVSAMELCRARLWRILREVRSLVGAPVQGLRYSPNGRYLFAFSAPMHPADRRYSTNGELVAGGSGRVVVVWDVQTGTVVKGLPGHLDTINCLALAPDGNWAVTGSMDTTARVWKLDELKPEASASVQVDAARVEVLWNELAGADAKKAYKAVRTLGRCTGPILPILRTRVKPVPASDARRIAGLIADLDSDRFAVRQKATWELERLGELVEADLKRMLANRPSLEMKSRIDMLLRRLETPSPLTSEEVLTWRAIEVLHLQGTAESKAVLEELAAGAADARRTRCARSALNGFPQAPTSR